MFVRYSFASSCRKQGMDTRWSYPKTNLLALIDAGNPGDSGDDILLNDDRLFINSNVLVLGAVVLVKGVEQSVDNRHGSLLINGEMLQCLGKTFGGNLLSQTGGSALEGVGGSDQELLQQCCHLFVRILEAITWMNSKVRSAC